MTINRRTALKLGVGFALLSRLGGNAQAQSSSATNPLPNYKLGLSYPYKLPELGYAYTALESNVDAETMELHHSKHHGSAVTALNKALEGAPDLQKLDLLELLVLYPSFPAALQGAIRNNAGNHYNHTQFWQWLAPGGSSAPVGTSAQVISTQFGDVTKLQALMKEAGSAQFGSGWAWLVLDKAGKLSVARTPNQDTPLTSGWIPVLGIDVWEHAYYLKHRNRRADYLDTVWKAVNWDSVEKSYQTALKAF
jgi:superoxide dismutase, Fe-Mn family